MDTQQDHFFEQHDIEPKNTELTDSGATAEPVHDHHEPMTADQRSFLKTLMDIHGETYDSNLTREQAAHLIEEKTQNITIPPPAYENTGNFWHALKDPSEWTAGEGPATEAQIFILKALAAEIGETINEDMTKAEANKRLEDLQNKTGRGFDPKTFISVY